MNSLFGSSLKYDLKASLVVFLVALPLCLGIAIASGAPPMSGLIAGIIGGIVVGAFSGSHVSVSGPAAGLTVIVLDSIIGNGLFSSLFSHLGDCRVDSGRTWYSKKPEWSAIISSLGDQRDAYRNRSDIDSGNRSHMVLVMMWIWWAMPAFFTNRWA